MSKHNRGGNLNGESEVKHESESFVNPFEHRITLTTWQKIQLAVMTVTIFPLRIIGVIIGLLLLIPVTKIATCGLPLVAEEPLKGWRRALKPVVRGLLRFSFFCCSYHKIEVKGQENLPKDHEPDLVVAAPHTTFFDTIIIFALNDLATGISRIENVQIPLMGNIAKFFTPISVRRSDYQSRQDTINQIKMRVRSRMKYRREKEGSSNDQTGKGEKESLDDDPDISGLNWPAICSFPEGTTGSGKSLIGFKLGAFIPGQPVQPVCIKHINAMSTTTWTWVGEGVWKILWLTMCQLGTKVEMTILPMYHPNPEEKVNPHLFSSNVQSVMAKQMGIPMADFNFFDCPFVVYLSKLSLQPVQPLVNLNRILMRVKKQYVIDPTEYIEDIVKSDLHIADPLMTYELFQKFTNECQGLKQLLDKSCDSKEFYEATKASESDKIDICKFLVWLSVSCQIQRTSVIIELAYKLYGSKGKNYLNEFQLKAIMKDLFQCTEAETSSIVDCIMAYSGKPSIADLEKFTLRHYDDEKECDRNDHCTPTCHCARILHRFFLDRDVLSKLSPGIDRKTKSNPCGWCQRNCKEVSDREIVCDDGKVNTGGLSDENVTKTDGGLLDDGGLSDDGDDDHTNLLDDHDGCGLNKMSEKFDGERVAIDASLKYNGEQTNGDSDGLDVNGGQINDGLIEPDNRVTDGGNMSKNGEKIEAGSGGDGGEKCLHNKKND